MRSISDLVHTIDRYGEAIEADFHVHYGLDLVDFFRGKHSWRKFWNLLDRLPVASHYREAVLSDPEVAAAMLDQPAGPPGRPALSEWTPLVAGVTNLADLLMVAISRLESLAGGKPGQVKPQPRPITAVDVLEAQRRRQQFDSLVAEVEASQARQSRAEG